MSELYYNSLILPDLGRTLALLPEDVGVVWLLRHSLRPPLPDKIFGMQVDLTPEGVELAEKFGRSFPKRLVSVRSSPSKRCIQTGDALVSGTGTALEVTLNPMLGEPGAFVTEVEASRQALVQYGPLGMVERMLQGELLGGERSITEGVRMMLNSILDSEPEPGTWHAEVTHDTLLSATLFCLEGRTQLVVEDWPRMLEGAALWRVPGGVRWIWRGTVYEREWPGLHP
ncbi:MAG TPA: histidine phosphatase family protein [Deltaproteobacteria bacterium]|jgi:hypothetical protein|nr:histidine phosphatase family protein [Candidatus Lambdaproteobacteria bacterium]HIL16795.1 histidine phosphatase family protein [Deltaproteobacteria bacterium]HIL88113.1 histidine phosphatase family protein [Deltaproteobacteria bacterium]|tara:strand:- start:1268 stop:1951 length:684 start_codon:yes stop_codon:yes gene_type:complete